MKKYNNMAWLEGKVEVAWCFAINGVIEDYAGWPSREKAQWAFDSVLAGTVPEFK